MRIRYVAAVFAALGLAACAESNSADHRVLRAQDPPLYGQAGLITRDELHAALVPARERLSKLAPASSILRVKVLTRSRLEVFYRFYSNETAGAFYQNSPNTGFLLLEFRNGVWEVKAGKGSEFISDPNVIVTG